jgi:hypothetical protein
MKSNSLGIPPAKKSGSGYSGLRSPILQFSNFNSADITFQSEINAPFPFLEKKRLIFLESAKLKLENLALATAPYYP